MTLVWQNSPLDYGCSALVFWTRRPGHHHGDHCVLPQVLIDGIITDHQVRRATDRVNPR